MAGVPLHTHCGFTNSGPLYPACLLVGDLAPAVRQATRVLSDQEVTDLDAMLQAPATLYDLQPMIPSATLYTRGLRIRSSKGSGPYIVLGRASRHATLRAYATNLVSTTAADVAGRGEAAGWSDRQRGGYQGYVPCLQPATCGLQPATWSRCDLGDGGEREAHRRRRAPATIRARGCSPGCYGLT